MYPEMSGGVAHAGCTHDLVFTASEVSRMSRLASEAGDSYHCTHYIRGLGKPNTPWYITDSEEVPVVVAKPASDKPQRATRYRR